MFSEFVNSDEKCLRSKAEFRANRERLGATQDDLSKALNVATRTVKRWESPDFQNPPSDAWEYLDKKCKMHSAAAKEIARKLDEIAYISGRDVLMLPYYRVAEGDCPPAGVSGMSNAQLREAAALCKAPIAFAYDSEIEKDIVYWMIKLALDIEEHGDDEFCYQLFEVPSGSNPNRPFLVGYSLSGNEIELYDGSEESTLGDTYWDLRNVLIGEFCPAAIIVTADGRGRYDEGIKRNCSSYRDWLVRTEADAFSQHAKDWRENIDLVDWFGCLHDALSAYAPEIDMNRYSPDSADPNDVMRVYDAIYHANLDTYDYSMFLGDYKETDFILMDLGIDYEAFTGWYDDEDRYNQLVGNGLEPSDYVEYFDDENIAYYGPDYDEEDEEL